MLPSRPRYPGHKDTAYKGNMLWPMYGRDGNIYFVSNELP